MAKYIEREAVMKTVKNGNHSDFGRSMADLTSLREVLEDTPAADVVEVVRCKDCEYAKEYKNNLFCCYYPRAPKSVSSNDYCSYGIKKD